MIKPSIDSLLEIVDSKYKLVLISANRAKRIEDKSPILIVKPLSRKPVGIALEEIMTGNLDQ